MFRNGTQEGLSLLLSLDFAEWASLRVYSEHTSSSIEEMVPFVLCVQARR